MSFKLSSSLGLLLHTSLFTPNSSLLFYVRFRLVSHDDQHVLLGMKILLGHAEHVVFGHLGNLFWKGGEIIETQPKKLDLSQHPREFRGRIKAPRETPDQIGFRVR